jgi:PTS system fructose-specific IIC component
VIPSIVAGSAITGALSMAFGATLAAPHGGLFVLLIPHAVGQPLLYLLSIVIGTAMTALLLNILKKEKVA